MLYNIISQMQKKIIVIVAVVGTLVLGGGLWWLSKGSGKGTPVSPEVSQTSSEPAQSSAEALTWEDPAGFTFEYPQGTKINNHPEDEVNYANLEMTYSANDGKILILAQDTTLKKISDWEKTQIKFSMDKLGGKEAKKISLNTGETTIGTLDSAILFTIQVTPGTDSQFWQKAFDQIVTSFKFWQPTPAQSGSNSATSGTSGGSGDIIEEEEIIE